MNRDFIAFTLNGKLHKVTGKYAFLPLSEYLRYERGLTGTKVVCAEGDCGACTVMIRRSGESSDRFKAINSCICTLFLLDGCHIVTVEGLGEKESLTEIQASMVRNFGGQCGFCTPGFVMAITNMYENAGDLSRQKAKNYLTGNLCRCTGYEPILDAVLDVDKSKVRSVSEFFDFSKLELEMEAVRTNSIFISWKEKLFLAPRTLEEAVNFNVKEQARIFSGATDIGVQANKGRDPGRALMSLQLIEELNKLEDLGEEISVGARVSLHDLQIFTEDLAPEFSQFLNIFASPQIKNTATLIGNIANGSPIADTTPYMLTAEAVVTLFGPTGERQLPLLDFIKGYKKFDLREGELITKIRFKKFPSNFIMGLYKVSQRRDLDISCVNSSFVFELDGGEIKSSRISYGGVGPQAFRLHEVEAFLVGKKIDLSFLAEAKKKIAESITPISDARGTSEFRELISQSLFEKFCEEKLNE